MAAAPRAAVASRTGGALTPASMNFAAGASAAGPCCYEHPHLRPGTIAARAVGILPELKQRRRCQGRKQQAAFLANPTATAAAAAASHTAAAAAAGRASVAAFPGNRCYHSSSAQSSSHGSSSCFATAASCCFAASDAARVCSSIDGGISSSSIGSSSSASNSTSSRAGCRSRLAESFCPGTSSTVTSFMLLAAAKDGPRRRRCVVCWAHHQQPHGPGRKGRRDLLIEYVQGVQPDFMDKFFQRADEQVVDAMRQTVSNMLGSLPPQFFEVTVSTLGENLAQLMFSVMMTGYMFRNAQYRVELAHTLAAPGGNGRGLLPPAATAAAAAAAAAAGAAAGAADSSLAAAAAEAQGAAGTAGVLSNVLLPRVQDGAVGSADGSGSEGEEEGSASAWELQQDAYAPGSQTTHVSGDVLRWNVRSESVERVSAAEYIETLEGEVRQLQRQLEEEHQRQQGLLQRQNRLLEYIKNLEPKNLEELTASAEGDALEAMNVFVRRLLGVPDVAEIKDVQSRTTVSEMARLLYWLLVVGYSLRSLEVRYDMEQALLGPPATAAAAAAAAAAAGGSAQQISRTLPPAVPDEDAAL